MTNDDISRLCNSTSLTHSHIVLLCILVLIVLTVLIVLAGVIMHSKSELSTSLSVINDQLSELQICDAFCTPNKRNCGDVIEFNGTMQAVDDNKTFTDTLFHGVSTWPQYLAESNKLQVSQAIVRIHSRIGDNLFIQSNPFYAFEEGQLMSMRVYLNGNDDGEGTHVSLYLYPMKGPHDDKLEQSGHWPLRGTFTIELLNQLNDSDHYSINMTFGTNLPCECTNREVSKGWGMHRFISHTSLLKSDNYYYQNDTMYFRISYRNINHQIAPAVIKLSNFTKKIKNKEQWFSDPFFSFNRGYQMCLRVDAAGDGDGKGTHVSVYLHLMKGPYDHDLEQSGHWPLKGTFTIELLNQLIDRDCYSRKVIFTSETNSDIANRVLEGNRAVKGLGFHQFISHDSLLYSNDGYLNDDSLQFRINYQYHWEVVIAVSSLLHQLTNYIYNNFPLIMHTSRSILSYWL